MGGRLRSDEKEKRMKTIYRCQDCEWVNNPKECSKCGGVCFADETPEEKARERVRNAGPDLLAALEDATARLQGFIGSDCECDNTHAANNTVCCLCEYRAAIARARGVSA
jgi:hypothetical protein